MNVGIVQAAADCEFGGAFVIVVLRCENANGIFRLEFPVGIDCDKAAGLEGVSTLGNYFEDDLIVTVFPLTRVEVPFWCVAVGVEETFFNRPIFGEGAIQFVIICVGRKISAVFFLSIKRPVGNFVIELFVSFVGYGHAMDLNGVGFLNG